MGRLITALWAPCQVADSTYQILHLLQGSGVVHRGQIPRVAALGHSLQGAVAGTDGLTYEDTLPDESDDIENAVSDIAFREKLAALPERERKIAAMLIAGKNQEQIADAVGTSRSNVSRLAHKIGKAIRGG